MILRQTASLDTVNTPLEAAQLPKPVPGPGEILIGVSVCGVCHTEIDEIEGRTPPPVLPVVPGHEVVGRVEALGPECRLHRTGDRVGVGWIHHSDGGELENLSEAFRATGRDVNGGYAEYMTVPERYAYPIPARFTDEEAAPLLCAGAVGFRALALAGLRDGEVLGLTGFGGSGHLVMQLARHLYPRSPVFVFARSGRERAFARELGAAWAGDTQAEPPASPQAIIDTTPVWTTVLAALARLRPGGRLVINAIRKEPSDRGVLADISYARHLWLEKSVKTVANVTAEDIRRFLPIAAEVPLEVTTTRFGLESANDALKALKAGNVRGAFVLKI